MSEEKSPEPEQAAPASPDQTRVSPPAAEAIGPPPAWMPAPPPPPSVWNRIAAYIVLIAVVAAAAGAGIGWSLARAVNNRPVAQATTSPEAPIQQVTPGTTTSPNSTTAAIAAKVSPAIVDINTVLGNGAAAGSGMLISSTGEILTNNHVINGSTSITVTVQGRSQRYSAHVVGVDVSQDIAMIQIDGSVSGLPTVKFADSSSLKVGDRVVTLGNALGQGGAPHVTSGQITALDQTITASSGGSGGSETLGGMIQSDAVIYEGDSGGALVNTSGQVVGMITAGQAQGFRSSASDVGFAIASNTAVGIVNRIRSHDQAAELTYGQVGYLGVSVQTLDAFSAQQLGLSVTSGALVTGVQPGSAAESAGIARNSVITNVSGSAVTSSDTLGTAIRSHKPGDSVSVTWVNQTGTHTATVALAGVNP
jgi:S1-C subfamily serine protease